MRLAAGEGRLILIVAIGCGTHETFAQQPLDVAGRAASNLGKGAMVQMGGQQVGSDTAGRRGDDWLKQLSFDRGMRC